VLEPLDDTRSPRLVLRRPTADDVPELFAMYSDPRVWEGDPLLRHLSRARTEAAVERWGEGWRRHGLGLWVARAASGPGQGDLVGVGGCNLPREEAWNLAFTLRPESWGQGLAQEVAAVGTACARALRPDLPVTAAVAARNERSLRAVERAGLAQVWRGPDAKDPDPAAELVLCADRPLSEEQVRRLVR